MSVISKLLERRLAHDAETECMRQLVEWIASGTLVEEFRRDPRGVLGCVLTSVGTLFMAAGGWLDHDRTEPVFGFGTPPPDVADDISDQSVALASALDLKLVAGPLTSEFFKLLLQRLVAYLLEHLPELLDTLGGDEHPLAAAEESIPPAEEPEPEATNE